MPLAAEPIKPVQDYNFAQVTKQLSQLPKINNIPSQQQNNKNNNIADTPTKYMLEKPKTLEQVAAERDASNAMNSLPSSFIDYNIKSDGYKLDRIQNLLSDSQAMRESFQDFSQRNSINEWKAPENNNSNNHTAAQNPVFNTVAQMGRVLGGAAQGTVKTALAPIIMIEAGVTGAANPYETMQNNLLDKVNSTFTPQKPEAIFNIDEVKKAGPLNDEWMSQGNPIDQFKLMPETNPSTKNLTDMWGKTSNQAIQQWTDSWVPAPNNAIAEFVAKGADALGEAIPGMAATAATGGTSAIALLQGSVPSYLIAGLKAFSGEMIEGSGNPQRAVITGGIEAGTEALSGQTLGKLADSVSSKALSTGINVFSEGIEEVASGGLQALTFGEKYSPAQALEDFALGAFVGSMVEGGVSAANAVSKEINTNQIIKAINEGDGTSSGSGALTGLQKSIEAVEANPDLGVIAKALAQPAQESQMDMTVVRKYMESALKDNIDNTDQNYIVDIKIPKNIDQIKSKNIGQYSTTGSGLINIASIIEASQYKGLSPRQSGKILDAVLSKNTELYSKLADSGNDIIDVADKVQIERGADYHSALPQSGADNNYAVIDVSGRPAAQTENDTGINVFRGMSSEWVLPTLASGEFAVPNANIRSDNKNVDQKPKMTLFGSTTPGAMLGSGLYLTGLPSKADQYTSGILNEISMIGNDSGGIMKYGPILGGKTFVNEALLNQSESGIENNIVRRGKSGEETALKEFMNKSSGNPDAAVIYSKLGEDYTEIVRPDAAKTQIESLYLPLNAINYISPETSKSKNTIDDKNIYNPANDPSIIAGFKEMFGNQFEVTSNMFDINFNVDPEIAGYSQSQFANSAFFNELQLEKGNDDINPLLAKYITPDISMDVVSDVRTGRNTEIGVNEMINESFSTPEVLNTENNIFDNVNETILSEKEINTVPENNISEIISSESNNVIVETESTPNKTNMSVELIPSITPFEIKSREDTTVSDIKSPPTEMGNPISETVADNSIVSNTNIPPIEVINNNDQEIVEHENPVMTNHETRTGKIPSPNEGKSTELSVGSAEGKALSIWSPAQAQEQSQVRRRKPGSSDFDIVRGQPSTGQVYETMAYNRTFSSLSSY
ncbi:MAG: hypothetical protein FWF15_03485 [Oscillospiraceae bacterium]|nr:hypothetical protein [Oscillospiraceae bacterium]